KIGLLRADGTETFEGCIVVPVFTADGDLGECFARFIVDRKPTNHLYLPGAHRGVLNAKAAEVYEEIIITEAAFDALSLYAIGVMNVIPCYGTGGFTDDHAAALRSGKARKVFIAFDNDQAGEDGAKRLAQQLTGLVSDQSACECHRVHIPDLDGKVKDLNEYVRQLRGQGMKTEEIKAAFAALLKQAPRIGYTRERKTGGLELADQTADSLVFRNCEAMYRLRGLFDNNGNSLRVVVTATRRDSNHTDRLDLYTAKSRAGFAYRAAHRLELPAAKIEEDLNALIPVLETLLAEGKSKQEETADKPPEISEADRRDALALLRAPDLLNQVAADLETIGYVGEEKGKQLVYLIATSRKLDKPLSGIIRSESGAGKSFLMECVAELMPPEDVKYYSRLTPQSLYYMGRDELVHKLLIVDERDGSEEAEYPIRTLQTRRKLTLAVPVKDPSTGKSKTRMLEILGPMSYLESTTATMINPENSNRSFEVYLDESDEQTRRIYAAQRKAHTLAGWRAEDRRAAAIRRHQNAQRLLRPVRVLIPFTEKIKFPESWTRGRRDNERMLYLVEVIAFLHQHHRPVKSDSVKGDYIEATVEDYAAAYGLAHAALSQALCDLPRLARTVLSHLRVMVKEWSERLGIAEKDYGFRQRDIREFTKLPHHVIKRAMKSLEELEFVHIRGGGRGRTPVYMLASVQQPGDPLAGLTTPEELKRQWKP
ncbi:MAG: toprim domain-containing protein, partial [Verrucomicrobia bacterium]|nr:toprim domain-containing protein [Verrucomicrobiota bacterium]